TPSPNPLPQGGEGKNDCVYRRLSELSPSRRLRNASAVWRDRRRCHGPGPQPGPDQPDPGAHRPGAAQLSERPHAAPGLARRALYARRVGRRAARRSRHPEEFDGHLFAPDAGRELRPQGRRQRHRAAHRQRPRRQQLQSARGRLSLAELAGRCAHAGGADRGPGNRLAHLALSQEPPDLKLGPRASAEAQIERDPKLRLALFFGPDSGLAHERAKALVARVAGDASDANAGGAVEDFLGHPMGDALVVVEAGDLASRSSLRKLAEESPIALAIGCYHDSGDAIEEVVRTTLGRHALTVSGDAMAYLEDRLGNDRMVSRGELDKLALYMQGKTRVELEDAVACVGDHAALSVSDAIHAAAEGDPPALDRALAVASREGESAVGIVRQALRHFQRLHYIAAASAGGKAPGAVIASLRPPVFKRDQARLVQQLRLWSLPQLGQALQRLLEIESQTKSTGFPDQTICARGLLELARLAQRNRRQR